MPPQPIRSLPSVAHSSLARCRLAALTSFGHASQRAPRGWPHLASRRRCRLHSDARCDVLRASTARGRERRRDGTAQHGVSRTVHQSGVRESQPAFATPSRRPRRVSTRCGPVRVGPARRTGRQPAARVSSPSPPLLVILLVHHLVILLVHHLVILLVHHLVILLAHHLIILLAHHLDNLVP